MDWKKNLIHGIVAGLLAAIACGIYLNIYQSALGTDYGKIINIGGIAGSCIFGTLLMAIGYGLIEKLNQEKFIGMLNIIISTLSFASILGPVSMDLPLDVASPELFPGLTVPMHFFPAIAFFMLVPFFRQKSISL